MPDSGTYLRSADSLSDADLVAWIRNFKRQPPTLDLFRESQWARTLTPEAKRRGLQGCDGCNGSGIYYGRGYVENGVFKGFTGKCFRCNGKGFQTREDSRRNYGYDNFYRRVWA